MAVLCESAYAIYSSVRDLTDEEKVRYWDDWRLFGGAVRHACRGRSRQPGEEFREVYFGYIH